MKQQYKRPRKRAHEVDRKHTCQHCFKGYGNASSLNLHIRLKHSDQPQPQPSSALPAESDTRPADADRRAPAAIALDMGHSRRPSGPSAAVPHFAAPGSLQRQPSGGTGFRSLLNKRKRDGDLLAFGDGGIDDMEDHGEYNSSPPVSSQYVAEPEPVDPDNDFSLANAWPSSFKEHNNAGAAIYTIPLSYEALPPDPLPPLHADFDRYGISPSLHKALLASGTPALLDDSDEDMGVDYYSAPVARRRLRRLAAYRSSLASSSGSGSGGSAEGFDAGIASPAAVYGAAAATASLLSL